MDRYLSQRFKNMALVCAFVVVLIHCISNFDMFHPFIYNVIDDSCCRIAVPFFFFASGFFLYGHVGERNWWRRELVKRVRTLLIPYFILITLFLIPCLLVDTAGGGDGDQLSVGVLCSFYGLNPMRHPILVPLWYIRALFIIVALSPVLVYLVRRLGVWVLLVTFALYGLLGPYEGISGSVHYFFRKTIAMQGIFYVSLGMAFRSGGLTVVVGRPKALGLLLLGLLLMTVKVCLQYQSNRLYLYFGWLAVPFLMLGVFNLITTRRWPDWCTSCAFPVYLAHMFVIRFAVVTCAHFSVLGIVQANVLIWIGVSIAIGMITFVGVALQRRLLPQLNRILYGGR